MKFLPQVMVQQGAHWRSLEISPSRKSLLVSGWRDKLWRLLLEPGADKSQSHKGDPGQEGRSTCGSFCSPVFCQRLPLVESSRLIPCDNAEQSRGPEGMDLSAQDQRSWYLVSWAPLMYWVRQKVHSGFSVTSYRKTWTNFLANQYKVT